VGANIGETIAVIEQHSAGRFSYFCIEPDHDLAELCRLNYAAKPQVHVEECFVGEKEGAEVWLQDDGTANPSTRIVTDGHHNDKSNYGKLFRLDTVAGPFSESNGGLSLLKIDTEGYDFSILRSASNILNKYKPAVYFEWFPKLLINLNEDVWSGFEYLATFGYRYFVFFTSRGDYYCTISNPGRLFLRSLSSIALGDASMEYFDVLASTQEQVCSQVVEESIRILLDNKLTRR
jgi:FkbM family methyltransferase